LTTAVGLTAGFDSPSFATAAVFALVVMYDASGVRRAAGKQAEVLNKIVDDMAHHHTIREERLKELLGHTPIEVFGGALLGIALAILIL
jgi:acid phosphatase family membrane protein YuiD